MADTSTVVIAVSTVTPSQKDVKLTRKVRETNIITIPDIKNNKEQHPHYSTVIAGKEGFFIIIYVDYTCILL